jgi:hypothetical protein
VTYAVSYAGAEAEAFAVVVARDRALVLVQGTNMVYEPGRQVSYGWSPIRPRLMPHSDVLLCQALALAAPFGLITMLEEACQWPRDCTNSPRIRGAGPAWTAVDRLVAEHF